MWCLLTQICNIAMKVISLTMRQPPQARDDMYDMKGTQSVCDDVKSATRTQWKPKLLILMTGAMTTQES